MTKQDKIKVNIRPKGVYNINYIEHNSGLRKLKLYEFLHGKAKLSDTEAASVLDCIRNATRLQR